MGIPQLCHIPRLACRRGSYIMPTPWSRLPGEQAVWYPPPTPSRAHTKKVYGTLQAREGDFNFIFNRIFKGAVAPLDPLERQLSQRESRDLAPPMGELAARSAD